MLNTRERRSILQRLQMVQDLPRTGGGPEVRRARRRADERDVVMGPVGGGVLGGVGLVVGVENGVVGVEVWVVGDHYSRG